jgi:glucosamine-6-phosphate deaminase
MKMLRSFQTGGLQVRVYENREDLGRAAADMLAERIKERLGSAGPLSMIFASAPSQTETLRHLAGQSGIAWDRISGFHLDEYAGAKETDAHSFRKFLEDHLLSKVTLQSFHGLRGEAADLEEACRDYAALLRQASPRLALLGIGENGHLAFNDPPVADFEDPLDVKVVELDLACREQQVHDGAFAKLADVPARALTLTVPAIMRVPEVVAVVPGPRKKHAVKEAVEGRIGTSCPASILRTHAAAHLFLDAESAALLS